MTDDNGSPIHRNDAIHPDTNKFDRSRASPGDRYRIECIEFELGRRVCGHVDDVTGEYCRKPVREGNMRCGKHVRSTGTVNDINKDAPYPPSIVYGMELNSFFRCRTCRDLDCAFFTNDHRSDECVIEREIFDKVMITAADYEVTDELSLQSVRMLAWNMAKAFRAEHWIARDGFTVTECTGFKGEDGSIEMIENIREHPVLKHIPKFQTSMLALADSLELTPKARSKKATDESSARRETRVEEMLMEAHRKRTEEAIE